MNKLTFLALPLALSLLGAAPLLATPNKEAEPNGAGVKMAASYGSTISMADAGLSFVTAYKEIFANNKTVCIYDGATEGTSTICLEAAPYGTQTDADRPITEFTDIDLSYYTLYGAGNHANLTDPETLGSNLYIRGGTIGWVYLGAYSGKVSDGNYKLDMRGGVIRTSLGVGSTAIAVHTESGTNYSATLFDADIGTLHLGANVNYASNVITSISMNNGIIRNGFQQGPAVDSAVNHNGSVSFQMLGGRLDRKNNTDGSKKGINFQSDKTTIGSGYIRIANGTVYDGIDVTGFTAANAKIEIDGGCIMGGITGATPVNDAGATVLATTAALSPTTYDVDARSRVTDIVYVGSPTYSDSFVYLGKDPASTKFAVTLYLPADTGINKLTVNNLEYTGNDIMAGNSGILSNASGGSSSSGPGSSTSSDPDSTSSEPGSSSSSVVSETLTTSNGVDNFVPGGTVQLLTTLPGATSTNVDWSVSNNNSDKTLIDSTGLLTVGEDETAKELVVQASLQSDPSMKQTMTLTLSTTPSSGLGVGAIIGIVIACIFFLFLLLVGFYVLWKYSILKGEVWNKLIRWMDPAAIKVCRLFHKKDDALFTKEGTKDEQKERDEKKPVADKLDDTKKDE